ncbi:MAG: DNA polymerase III subunit gamma/tau domain-containing protein [Planctomycetota bacterium]
MNRPFDPRQKGAHTADSARRAGHSSLGLMLLLGVLLAGVVGARIGLQEGGEGEGATPQAQTGAPGEAAEPQLTKEEQDRQNHLAVMVKLQENALANIDQLTPSQRAAHDAVDTEDERLSFLVRGKRLRQGLGERGTEMYGALNELPAERRNGHMRKLKNTLANEYRGSVEKFGDEAGLDERQVKNAQKARARERRVQWLAEFEQKRLREMRGSGALPAGMDQATYDRLIAEEDPHAFLRGLNTSRLDPPSANGDARDPESGDGVNVPISNLGAANNGRPNRNDLNRDGAGQPVRVEPGAGEAEGARPGANPAGRNPAGGNPASGERAGVGDRDGAAASRESSTSDTPDDSGSAGRNRPEGVGDRDGAPSNNDGGNAGAQAPEREGQRPGNAGRGDGAQPERMTAMESLEAARKLGQILDTAPDRTREWADAIGGGVQAEQPQERLQEYTDKVTQLRDLIADSGLTPQLRKKYRVDEIHDLHLVVTVLGSGGVDVERDARLLAQIAQLEERNAAQAQAERAPSEGAQAPQPPVGSAEVAEKGGERPAAPRESGPAPSESGPAAAAAAEAQPSTEPLSLAESRKAANELGRMLDRVPAEARALAAALGGGVDSDDAQERFASYRDKAGRLRALIEQSSLTRELREEFKIDRMQDEVLVVTVLGSGGVDVARDVALLDQLAVAEVKRAARESAERQATNSAEDAAVAQGTQPVGDRPTDGAPTGQPQRDPGARGDGARADGARADIARDDGARGNDPNAGRGARAPEGAGTAGPSLAELRQAAEQERQALLKQLEGRPAVARGLAEHARFNDDDLARTREMPPVEGLRERYSLAAERVVREALKAELMSLDRVDSILDYEPGFLPLTVRQAAGEDVERDLKRLRQLSAQANANAALNRAGVAGAGEAQPETEASSDDVEAPAGAEPEMQSVSADGGAERGARDGNAQANAAGEQAQEGPAQPTSAPKPLVGLTVDDSSPDIELPPRPKVPQAGSGSPKRGPRIPPHLRNRPSAREQVESMGDRMRNAGTRPSGQTQREKPKEDDPEEKSGEDKPKGDGQKGQDDPAGAGSAGSTGRRP